MKVPGLEKALDGLKGISACIIALFVHYGHFYSGWPSYMYKFPWLFDWGWLAVELFYVVRLWHMLGI